MQCADENFKKTAHEGAKNPPHFPYRGTFCTIPHGSSGEKSGGKYACFTARAVLYSALAAFMKMGYICKLRLKFGS